MMFCGLLLLFMLFCAALAFWTASPRGLLGVLALSELGLLCCCLALCRLELRLAAANTVLEENRRHLGLVLEAANIGTWDWRPQRNELHANGVFFALLGREPARGPQTQQQWEELIHPDDRAAVKAALQPFLDGDDGCCRFECRMRTAEGGWKWIRPAGRVVVRDAYGRAERFMSVNIDITLRKEAEAELLEQHQRLITFMETLPDAAFLKDGLGRWQLTNQAGRQLFQAENLDWQGKTDEELAAERPFFAAAHLMCARSDQAAWQKKEMLIDYENVTDAAGRERIFEIRKMPLFFPDGRRKALVIIGRDITEQRHMEQQLIAARQQAEAASQAKSKFLASMSHEIRTPMHAIIGLSRLALATALSGKQKNYIEKIHASAELLLGILNDILDVSKIEAGKMEIEQIDFHLQTVLDNLDSLIGFRAAEKGLTLTIECAGTVPQVLKGDPFRLGQILLNLANNAVKFTHQGGVTVRVAAEEAAAERVSLHFSVADTGIGMSAEQRDKLFQPFSQTNCSIARQYGGTGLGLAISKKLTELMGGAIWAESEAGQGSVFHVVLPFALGRDPAPGRGRHKAASDAARLRGARILLAEDNEINKELAVELLRKQGMLVTTARNGEEALQALERSSFDGVLMDIQMPVMDGYAACRAIRSRPEWHDLPVIALTANVMAGDREKSREAGMNGHIGKPFSEEEMFSIMAAFIRPNQYSAAEAEEIPPGYVEAESFIFSGLVGINAEKGLANAMDDPAFFQKILRLFRTDQAEFEQQFMAAQESGDLVAATRLAHTLKTVAATIGATSLEQTALRLELLCRQRGQEQETALLFRQTVTELERVLAGLDRFFAEQRN